MRWAKHVAGMRKKINTSRTLVRKPEGQRLFKGTLLRIETFED